MKLDELLRTPRSHANPDRVESIVSRARREVAAKDLLDFGGARIWLALMSLVGLLAMVTGSRPTRERNNALEDRS